MLARQDIRERNRLIANHVSEFADPAQAARHFSVSYNTVKNACREHGVECSKANKVQPASSTIQILGRCINSDETVSKIARDFGVTRNRVYNIIREAEQCGIQVKCRKRAYNKKFP